MNSRLWRFAALECIWEISFVYVSLAYHQMVKIALNLYSNLKNPEKISTIHLDLMLQLIPKDLPFFLYFQS